MAKRAAIGIDLGTTYSCAGVYYNGKVEIVNNKEGNKTTPSFVAFKDGGRLYGQPAKEQFSFNLKRTVYDAKRMIGKAYDDPDVQADRQVWPFNIVEVHGKLKIEVEYNGDTKTFFPEQISSMILTTMKRCCETFLGYQVTNAVITIPAYFNDSQRQATKDAGTIAGLTVLRIINEPTAAAIAFGFREQLNVEKKVLIYDLGGGTFDISILSIERGVFKVIAVAGETHLGGQDFDQRIAKHLADAFQRKYEKNCWNDKRSVIKLMTHSERAKRTLSTSKEATVSIESFFENIDFQMKLTRASFESLNADLFNATIVHVEKALTDSKLDKNDIDEVVLVGGSTRIPRVQELLKKFFNRKVLNEKVNADEAVAIGAAIQASILNGDYDTPTQNIKLHDVTPHSLGIEACIDDVCDIMSVLIKKNSSIPKKTTKEYRTRYDNQTSVTCKVFAGENTMTKDNHWLGEFRVVGIPPRKAHEEKIDVTFDIDANGIMNVTAVNRSTGQKNNIIINKKRLETDELITIHNENEKLRIEDDENDKVIQAKDSLERSCRYNQLAVEALKNKIHQTERESILEECEEILKWIDENPNAAFDEYVSRDTDLKKLSKEIFQIDVLVLYGEANMPD